ncbi:MAG: helix-turn-helix transcriptional regulator [Clostridia bacterium]|nr:helix-turn-helix transcriptional regulator [Clostridia bacterium]
MEFKIKTMDNTLSVTGIANVHFFDFDKNTVTEFDKHPFYELVYVSSGELEVASDNYNGKLNKNMMIIHSLNEKHSLSCYETQKTTVIIIGFTCEGFKSEYFSKAPILLSESNIKKLAEIVKEGRNVFMPPHNVPVYNMKKNKSQPFASEQLLKILLEYFLLSIMRELLGKQNTVDKSSLYTFNVSELIGYLDDKYKEKITLKELAFLFNTNRTTLCKEFKKATQTTILDYVANKKLLDAQNLIKTTGKTFTEISEELNFESVHYFTRFFTKHVGISPKKYRKQN